MSRTQDLYDKPASLLAACKVSYANSGFIPPDMLAGGFNPPRHKAAIAGRANN